jgi:DNA-directed RNA polymerase alpha subunit
MDTPDDLNDRIETLGLSRRTCGCLRRAGVHRVSQLVRLSARDLAQVKGIGERALDEILSRVSSAAPAKHEALDARLADARLADEWLADARLASLHVGVLGLDTNRPSSSPA